MTTACNPPEGLGSAGRELWERFAGEWDLDAREYTALSLAARTADELAEIEEALDRDGPVVVGSTGQPRANPLLEESRRHREQIRRLLSQLADEPVGKAGTASRAAQDLASARWRRDGRRAS